MEIEIELSAEDISDGMDKVKLLPAETRKDAMIEQILKWCQDTAEEEVAYALENAEWEDAEIEKVGCNFVVSKFSDCKTLEDFTSAFNEIRNRSYNFMT